MAVLRISLFGTMRVMQNDDPTPVKVTRVVQNLLAYLVLDRCRNYPRHVLAGLFWGDSSEDQALGSLNTALWRLRRVLEPDGTPRGSYLVTTPSGEVGFNWDSEHWVDVAAFEQCASPFLARPAHTLSAGDATQLESALALHTGELLEGFYDDWALRERERLRMMYFNVLAHLMRYHAHCGAYVEGLACGQAILSHDPLREEVHREMMRLYVAAGQRALAVRQYEVCQGVLQAEMGIQPMDETVALYRQILVEPGPAEGAAAVPGESGEPGQVREALQLLHQATRAFEQANLQVQRAVHLLEHVVVGQDGR